LADVPGPGPPRRRGPAGPHHLGAAVRLHVRRGTHARGVRGQGGGRAAVLGRVRGGPAAAGWLVVSTLPHGSWPSPLRAADLAGATVRLGEVAVSGGDTYWTEGRASEGGRTVLLRRDASGAVTRVSPETAPDGGTFDVRSRAQEYGGGSFAVVADTDGAPLVVASRKEDDRLYRLGEDTVPLTPADGRRYADLALDLGRGLVYAVAEDHGEPGGFRTDPPVTLVAVPLDD